MESEGDISLVIQHLVPEPSFRDKYEEGMDEIYRGYEEKLVDCNGGGGSSVKVNRAAASNSQYSGSGSCKNSNSKLLQYKTTNFTKLKSDAKDLSDAFISYDSFRSRKTFSNVSSPM